MADLAGRLRARTVKVHAGSQEYNILPQAAEMELAKELNMPRREIQITALESGIVPGRYLRNMGTVGVAGQLRLLSSTVAVVGCGGLGGLVVELLARMGVGRLVLVDGDVFDDNNLNRQVLCTEADLGKPKVMAAYERALAVNAAVEV
ncbi:MAG: ThiF family adenylyltransferase, partial [Desulfofundulus sp.]